METELWFKALEGVPQDPVHHAEGDVATHSRMALEALVALKEYQDLPPERQEVMRWAVALHDVAKPYCTQHSDDGRVTAHGHSRRGELMARRILWEAGVPAGRREHIAALIRHHQLPFWALERTDLERIVLRVSLLASNEDLALLATADILGRICDDQAQVLENIELFRGYCRELGVYQRPWDFASDHSRFMYFRTPGRDPRYAAYDDTRCTVTVMSGFPGAGKDTWIAANRPDSPVVSLDALRAKLNISPSADQRPVAAAAYEVARDHLRQRRDFVWNATNISRQQRDMCVGLAAAYHARVEIVALEVSPDVLHSRNAGRAHRVPDDVLKRLKDRWEAPDLTEAHRVERVDTERFVD
ncbi:MAG TPA: AAA family ATPase [Candidatus Limnocylindrales bacterium]|nr:AAA family ATPase [Candidatus Limnocylindrales bacterium]